MPLFHGFEGNTAFLIANYFGICLKEVDANQQASMEILISSLLLSVNKQNRKSV